MKLRKLKKCCVNVATHNVAYADRVVSLEKDLILLADLMASSSHDELSNESIHNLAQFIREYFDKKSVLDFFFFGKSLRWNIDKEILEKELNHLSTKFETEEIEVEL